MGALGNKNIMAENILHYMNQNQIDRGQLCKDLGFKYTTVCDWLSAKKYPRIDKIEKMAIYFGISKSDLIEDREPSNLTTQISDNVFTIPVFENVSAGFGSYADSQIIDYIPIILNSGYEAENTIGIRVKGNSMYPKIEDGDTIVVQRMDSVDSGSIAVVMLDGEEALVKKVEYGEDWINLISINPEYPIRHFENEEVIRLSVVGKVKQIIKTV